jgi:SAM-dependent methyltransferase
MIKALINWDKMKGIRIKEHIRDKVAPSIKKAFVTMDKAYTKFYYKHKDLLSVGCSIEDVSRKCEGESKKGELVDLIKKLLKLRGEMTLEMRFHGEVGKKYQEIIKVIEEVGKIVDLSTEEKKILFESNASDSSAALYYESGIECVMGSNVGGRELWLDQIRKLVGMDDDVERKMKGKVLDAGCGVGWLANLLSEEYGSDAYGIDQNPCACLLGRLFGVENLSVENMAKTRFEDNTFDVIFSLSALFCPGVLKETTEKAVAKEMFRILKDDGYLIVTQNAMEKIVACGEVVRPEDRIREVYLRFGLDMVVGGETEDFALIGGTQHFVLFKKAIPSA